jgi:hypothetical protein
MTSTYVATGFGALLGFGATALAYTTVPAYHDALVWSWGLVGLDLVAIFG